MDFNFEQIIDRRGTDSLKWELHAGQDVIPMWVADMDFEAPAVVIEALQRRVAHGVFGYTLAPDELTGVIVGRFRSHYGWAIAPEWLVWLPGVVPGLVAACRAFTQPDDEIVTFTPIYPPFLAAPAQAGRKLVTVPLIREEGRHTIDLAAFEAAITARTRLLLLCHPHNPVGRVFDRAELSAIAEICRRHDITICSDDIHCDLILNDTPHLPIATLSDEVAATSITLMSPGKTFNTAGLNMGFAVIPDSKLRAQYQAACKGVLPEPNVMGLTACLAAYRDGEPYRQALLKTLARNAACVLDFVRTELPELRMDPVEATYLAWIDASALGQANPTAFFRKHGVALSPGSAFADANYVRLNFGCPPSLLAEGLERMRGGVQAWRAGR
ncbi:MAG: putative C-S lyase [Lentisphaerae bacterium]|nr:putative C-S lyase [Lentisphaerota bacterium]